MRILAGDIGATNARLALVEWGDGGPRFLEEAHYESTRYEALEPILRDFTGRLSASPDAACLGVPGPVVEGRAVLTILGWDVREGSLAEAAAIPALRILNDFEAVARSVPLLAGDDLAILQEGVPPEPGTPGRPVAVAGAGTGLGHAYLTWEGRSLRVHPSEGGHVDFAPRTPLEWELREYLAGRFGRVSCERVVSGPGLMNVYRFLADTGWAPEDPGVREEMAVEDPAGVIARRGMDRSDPLCAKALEIFVSCYGAQVGDVALVLRAEGGVYLAGGIGPRILERLQDGSFLRAFLDKGRLRPFLERLPVKVILNPRAGLLGAAAFARGAGSREGADGPAGQGDSHRPILASPDPGQGGR
jgi:glucokinase